MLLCDHAEEFNRGGRPELLITNLFVLWSHLMQFASLYLYDGNAIFDSCTKRFWRRLKPQNRQRYREFSRIECERDKNLISPFQFLLSVCWLHCVGCFLVRFLATIFSYSDADFDFESKSIQPRCFEFPTACIKIKIKNP